MLLLFNSQQIYVASVQSILYKAEKIARLEIKKLQVQVLVQKNKRCYIDNMAQCFLSLSSYKCGEKGRKKQLAQMDVFGVKSNLNRGFSSTIEYDM